MLLVTLLIVGGRLVRHYLLHTGDGSWRDPLWLDGLLESPPPESSAYGTPLVLTSPLDINRCAAESLLALPGVGPVLAERILAARDSGVQFAKPADLQKIKGIGPKLTKRLTNLVLWPADTLLTTITATNSDSQAVLPK
jgi:hypothetical protein